MWNLFNLNGTGQNLPCDATLTDAIFSVALATAGAVASETPGESYEQNKMFITHLCIVFLFHI